MQKSKRLTLKPVKQEIEMAVESIVNLLSSLNLSDCNVQAQKLILKQLLKNVMKYGDFTLPENEITIIINITNKTITVEVMSPVDEKSSQSLRELDKSIQYVKGYQDPFEAFVIKQREAAKNTYYNDTNDLDIARTAYKGNAVLDFIVGDDNTLIQSAVRQLEENIGIVNYNQ